MRRLIYDLLSTDPNLMSMLPGGLWGDRAVEGVPAKPFAIMTFNGPLPGVSRMRQTRLTLWVHDISTDYTRIDDVLKTARELILSSPPRKLGEVWMVAAEWEGDSTDLFDEARSTNTRNGVFLLTGSGL